MSRMPTPARIAIGGFQHETNTFAPYTAPFEEFVKTDSWPGLAQGDAIFSVMSGMNIPVAGFIEAAKRDQHQLIPMLWCSAEPSSYVTTDAFEKVAGMLCDGLREIRDLDAVYLDLHGAMVVENFEDAESLFVDALLLPDEAVMQAQRNTSSQPVVLADVQDNSGAGGTSDTTGLLAALVRNRAQGAVLGVMHDPEVAALAHNLGKGAEFDASLGGKNGPAGVSPFKGRFVVEALADGNFRFTGDMYKGSPAELGPMALLRIVDQDSDVGVIVGSERVQCLDLAIFRHLGVEPEAQRILAVKSSVHFRADFDPIAAETLVVAAAGVSSCQLAKLTYKNLRSGVRLEPSGFTAKAKSDQM